MHHFPHTTIAHDGLRSAVFNPIPPIMHACLAGYIYPDQCIQLGFRYRLMLRVFSPILLLFAIPLGKVAFVFCRNVVQMIGGKHIDPPVVVGSACGRGIRLLVGALVKAVPLALKISFLLVSTVSQSIFDTWDCSEYELDSDKVRTFLNADLQIVCRGNDYPEEYKTIKTIAYASLLLWPIGMPLIYIVVLFPIRAMLRQRKQTRWVKATEFLHQDYKPARFWWEIVTLTQRLVLSGFVLLIPVEADSWRIFLGLLTAIGYLSLIQLVQP